MKFTDLFSAHIDPLRIEVSQKRAIQASLVAGSLSMFLTASLAPNQSKVNLGSELLLGSLFAIASAYVSKKREDTESRYKAFLELNKDHYKAGVASEFSYRMAQNDIISELNIAKFVRELPPEAQLRYKEKLKLDGLVALPRHNPVKEEELVTQTQQTYKRNNVSVGDVEIIDTFINKDSKSLLKNLALQYPQFLKLDSSWITDLVASSTHPDMSKRINHSLYLCGETQSGKTTLASVLISLIAGRSSTPATVAIHDAKKDKDGMEINDWLCEYSYKLPGFESAKDWLKLTNKLIQEHKKKAGEIGLTNLPEFLVVQDEVDTVYGKGKGYGEIIDSQLALKLQSAWLSWIKTLAGFKGHAVFMGQSPIAEDTGINKPSMRNICFICINNTTDYILKNANLFLSHVTEEEINLLKELCSLFEQMRTADPDGGLRYALVRPMGGKPYVALIPTFKHSTEINNVLEIDNNEGLGNDDNERSFNVNDSSDKFDNIDHHSDDVSDVLSVDPAHHGTTNNNEKPNLYGILADWVIKMKIEKGIDISDDDMKRAWLKIADKELTDGAVQILREIIEKKLKITGKIE